MLVSSKQHKAKPTNMRPSSNLDNDSGFMETDWDEPEERTSTNDLTGAVRSPVEESFYESYIIQSRTAVDNLYASNVLSCQKHMKEVGDLARQRKVKLSSLEREQKKLVKRMGELKLKQEVHLKKRAKIMANDLTSARSTSAKTGATSAGTERRRDSLPPLTTETADTEGDTSKSSVRLGLPGNILSKSCNDLRSLSGHNSSEPDTNLLLPAIHNDIKPSRSLENVSVPESPFVTQMPLKVHKDPHTNRGLVSRDIDRSQATRPRPLNWNEKKFKSDISTKVKWVPRT